MSLPVSFYLTCLLSNVMFISVYAVQVYSPHPTCIVRGIDVTTKFDLAFKLGLAIVFIDFLNLNVLSFLTVKERCSSCTPLKERYEPGVDKTLAFDLFIKGLTLLLTGCQYKILTEKDSLFCSQTTGTL